MKYRTLGKTGWEVSAIGFGAWGVGGQWGAVEKAQAIETIRASHETGVNFFDTADAYGVPPGTSEELIGEALGPVREKVLIATKVGNFARRAGFPLSYETPMHVELCCDASLHRLKTDVIDLYQCHIGNLKDPSIFLEAFDGLIRKGKIRAGAVSTNSVELVKAFNREGQCAAVQLEYSFLNRGTEKDLLPYCREANIGVIVRGPLAKGVATGKFTRETKFEDSVRQGWNDGPAREDFLKRLEIVERLRWLEQPGRNLAQAALQFVLAHPAVSTAIPGAKSPEQARANAAAAEGALSDEEQSRIREVTG